MIEDYVHDEPLKIGSLLLMKALCVLLGLISKVAVLKIGLRPLAEMIPSSSRVLRCTASLVN